MAKKSTLTTFDFSELRSVEEITAGLRPCFTDAELEEELSQLTPAEQVFLLHSGWTYLLRVRADSVDGK